MKDKIRSVGAVNFHRFVSWINDPVFSHSGTLINIFFIGPVISHSAGGEDFDYKIGSTVNAIVFNFITITDHHHVRYEMIFFC